MVMGRLKNAVSDVAETIRRAFSDPPCHAVSTPLSQPGSAAVALLDARIEPVAFRFMPTTTALDLTFPSCVQSEATRFEAKLSREDAWASWAAGAKVCEMPVFRAGSCGRVAVPPLPRSAVARRLDLPAFRTASRTVREPFAPPIVRASPPRLAQARTRRDLDMVLGLPIAIPGEDFQKLPKALNMRFTFQLVKATGENIRNLDVLGVFPVPVKGVTALRHDPKSGRILVNLDQDAVGARRGRFILARKKDDRSYVSCFVEE